MSRATITDRICRLLYTTAYRMARGWWRLRRPDHHGVVVAIWLDGRVLGVRQSYRGGMTFPGGGIHRGEDETQAALRELREELGLFVTASDLALVRRTTVEWDYRQDHVRIFELRLIAAPVLTIDNREIVRADFIDPAELLAAGTPTFIRAYLSEHAARSAPRSQ